jgi:DNA-directed RNA polymerase II subunit RPB1
MRIMVSYPQQRDEQRGPGERKRSLSAEDVLKIFKKISDKAIETMGLDPRWARPEWLLVTVFPVPPPHVRPSVPMDGGGWCEDDLTHQLVTIVKANMKLQEAMSKGETNDICDRYEGLLQEKVANFCDNERNGAEQEKHKSGKGA